MNFKQYVLIIISVICGTSIIRQLQAFDVPTLTMLGRQAQIEYMRWPLLLPDETLKSASIELGKLSLYTLAAQLRISATRSKNRPQEVTDFLNEHSNTITALCSQSEKLRQGLEARVTSTTRPGLTQQGARDINELLKTLATANQQTLRLNALIQQPSTTRNL